MDALDRGIIVFLCGELRRIRQRALYRSDHGVHLIRRWNSRKSRKCEPTTVASDLQPVDPAKDIFDGIARLGNEGTLFHKFRYDTFDQSDLGILETLETPTIELDAEHILVAVEAVLNHFENAGLPGTPIAVHPDRHRVLGILPQ